MKPKSFEQRVADGIFASIEKGLGYVSSLIYGKPRCNAELKSIIIRKISEIGPYDAKTTVMEYDKLVSFALTKIGVRGENFARKIKNYKRYMSARDYKNVWKAHMVRNKLSHEIDYKPTENELFSAQSDFKGFLTRICNE